MVTMDDHPERSWNSPLRYQLLRKEKNVDNDLLIG